MTCALRFRGSLFLAAAILAGCSVDEGDKGPDLRINRVTVVPEFPVAGETFTVSFRTINEGTRSATASAWRISLGITVINGPIPALDDGETFTFAHTFTATDPGAVTVTATVDRDDVVDETDEGDNTASALVTIGAFGGG
jgi:subtilase family serine protease